MRSVTAASDVTRRGGRRQRLVAALLLCLSLALAGVAWGLTTEEEGPLSLLPGSANGSPGLGVSGGLGEMEGGGFSGLTGDDVLSFSRLWSRTRESTSSWDLPWTQPRRPALAARGSGGTVSGGQPLNLRSELRGGRSVSFTSTYSESRAEEAFALGPTASDSSHRLSLELAPGMRVEAGLSQHEGGWDARTGKPGEETQEQKVQFSTSLGPEGRGDLRLGLTSMDLSKGGEKQRSRKTEAHLNLAPASGLKLTGDFAAVDSGSGEATTTQSVGASMALAPKTELAATMKRTGGSQEVRETGLSLSTQLGLCGLKAEEKRSENGGTAVRLRRAQLTGGFGNSARPTQVAVEFMDSQGEGSEGMRAGETKFHVDQALGPGLAVKAEHKERIEGTRAEPAVSVEDRGELTAKLGERASVSAGLVTGERPDGTALAQRKVAVDGSWAGARVKLEESAHREGDQEQSRLAASVELPGGELPEWAQGVATAHQFEDTKKYLLRGDFFEGRQRLSFAGWSAWAVSRGGGADDGAVSLGVAYRRMVGDRLHLQTTVEQRPEAGEGDLAGRPLGLRRATAELGARVGRKLSARCGLGLETGLESAEDRVMQVGMGVWGARREGEQVEAAITHEMGRWQGQVRGGTGVSLLYARRVSEEHRVEAKVGYAWGGGLAEGRGRDWRVTLGYEKPV